ncbi:M-phase inducer phosphatase 3-like [Tachyglossus aculeatus]|uniref:M-phase inducer phosphatase 3-like n=1 Tax=Tachyglossus aculeatus TaxID=9261 RepID=UPI0018F74BE1|nr:M-phase inducer phosphatase 3-like [Tachyglossus aculeatus]
MASLLCIRRPPGFTLRELGTLRQQQWKLQLVSHSLLFSQPGWFQYQAPSYLAGIVIFKGPAGPPSSDRCPDTSPDRRQEGRAVPEESRRDELRSPGFAASSLALAQTPLPQVEDEILIEDVWRPFCLPVEAGKHQDLCYVSSDTVAALLQGGYAQSVEEFVVVDCRYPYEYAGGHIKGALNLYREDQLVERFLQRPRCPPEGPKSHVFIFHCEFSSERGPRL